MKCLNLLFGTAVFFVFAINGLQSTVPSVRTCDDIRDTLPDDCSCDNQTQTLWYVTFSGIRVVCPQLVFELYPNNVTIQCRENRKDDSVPVPFTLGLASVTFLNVQHCTDRGWSLSDITDHFNVTHVYTFSVQGHIPTLNKSLFCNLTDIFMIDLSNIGLEAIPADSFECLASNANINGHSITHLEIDDNNISYLSEDSFKSLKQLSILKLMRNNLTNLPEGLFWQNTALDSLDLSFNQLSNLPVNLFANLTNLTRLDLQGNLLVEIPRNLLAPLKRLEVLDLGGNRLRHVSPGEDLFLERLVHLSLRDNQLTSLDGAHAGVFTLHSSIDLKHLRLDGNRLSRVYEEWTWMTQLEKLNLSYNQFSSLQMADLGFRSNIVVDLSHNLITEVNTTSATSPSDPDQPANTCALLLHDNPFTCDCVLYPFVQRLQRTQKLRVPHTKISPLVARTTVVDFRDLHSSRCSLPDGVRGVPLIEAGEVITCEIADVDYSCPTQCLCVYRPNDRANVVDCANAGLNRIPSPLSVYSRANQTILNLQQNPLEQFVFPRDGSFFNNISVLNLSNAALTEFVVSSAYRNIKVLDLSHNQLSTLSADVLTVMAQADLVMLHDNPWRCHCENLKMITAVITRIKVGMIEEVKCENSTALVDLKVADLCPPLYGSLTAAVCLVLAGLLLTLTAALCFSVNHCFQRRSKLLQSKLRDAEELDKKEYDAFISFADKDVDFVSEVLVPRLDGCRLCLRYRDWTDGEARPKQIISSVQRSRCSIVVLSPHYLASPGSVAEFSVAHTEATRNNTSRLIVILHREITDEPRISNEISACLRKKAYIKWEDTPSFWNKIFQLMPLSAKEKESENSFSNQLNVKLPRKVVSDSFNLVPLPQAMQNNMHQQ